MCKSWKEHDSNVQFRLPSGKVGRKWKRQTLTLLKSCNIVMRLLPTRARITYKTNSCQHNTITKIQKVHTSTLKNKNHIVYELKLREFLCHWHAMQCAMRFWRNVPKNADIMFKFTNIFLLPRFSYRFCYLLYCFLYFAKNGFLYLVYMFRN